MYFCSNNWDLRRTLDFEALAGKLFNHSCFRHCVALILQLRKEKLKLSVRVAFSGCPEDGSAG